MTETIKQFRKGLLFAFLIYTWGAFNGWHLKNIWDSFNAQKTAAKYIKRVDTTGYFITIKIDTVENWIIGKGTDYIDEPFPCDINQEVVKYVYWHPILNGGEIR